MKRLLSIVILCTLSATSSASWLFGGSDDYLVVGTTPVTAFPITVSLWVKTAACNNDAIITISDTTIDDNDAFQARITASCESAGTIDGSAVTAISTDTFSTNTWANIIVIFASTTDMRTYVDNGAGNGSDTTVTAPLSSTNMRLGGRFAAAPNDFTGNIGHAAVFDVAINSTTRSDLQSCTPDTTDEGADVVAYWPLDANNTDDSVGTYDLTIEGDSVTFDSGDDPSVSACGSTTTLFRRRR